MGSFAPKPHSACSKVLGEESCGPGVLLALQNKVQGYRGFARGTIGSVPKSVHIPQQKDHYFLEFLQLLAWQRLPAGLLSLVSLERGKIGSLSHLRVPRASREPTKMESKQRCTLGEDHPSVDGLAIQELVSPNQIDS